GRSESAAEMLWRGCRPGRPAARTSAAPTAGRSAAYPGNAVVEEKPSAATAIAAQPIQPRTKRAEEGRRRATAGAARASAAPSASSQARAKVEKYADAGLALVAWIDHARET